MMADILQPVLLWLMIVVWWIGYFIATITSRRALLDDGEKSHAHQGVTNEFLDFQWMELTAFQHIVGAVVSVAGVKVMGNSIFPSGALGHKKIVILAALGHFMGTLATNAAYTIVSSDVALIVSACQPLFSFLLTSMVLSSNDLSSFLSVAIIVTGIIAFGMNNNPLFNSWGLAAATVSITAFTARNILLKSVSEVWNHSLEKFMAISCASAIFSLPLLCIKVALSRTIFASGVLERGVISIIHPAYSLASFKVLEIVSVVSHAIVTICIRLFVNMENITWIMEAKFSWNLIISVFVVFVGLCLYYLNSQHTSTRWLVLKILMFVSVVGYFLLLNPIKSSAVLDYRTMRGNNVHMAMVPNKGKLAGEYPRISTAWAYDRPITGSVVTNIGRLADRYPNIKVYVYCGTAQCLHEVAALNKNNIVVGYAVVSDLVKGTPLVNWVARHPINKLLAGMDFEKNLHEVMILGILWQYGGVYVNPMVNVESGIIPEQHNGSSHFLEVIRPNGGQFSVLDVLYSSRNHPVIQRLADVYVKKYPTTIQDGSSFKFNFMDAVWKPVDSECKNNSCFYTEHDGPLVLIHNIPHSIETWTNHYGTLTNHSLDDELENFAALQYIPFADTFIERGNLQGFDVRGNVTIFLNGKWDVPQGSGTLLENLNPIILSLRLENVVSSEQSSYLRTQEPIGCGDVRTLNYLQSKGVKAFYPNHLILLMKNPNSDIQRNDVYFTDVNSEHVKLFPKQIQASAVFLAPKKKTAQDRVTLSTAAFELIEKLGAAKLVVTQNLQHAFTCVTMETPVIYINSSKEGEQSPELASLVHMLDVHNMTKEKAMDWLGKFAWDKIPHNPNPAILMKSRTTSWNVIRRNQHLYDAAVKFGVVPMSPPVSALEEKKLVFYLIFTTSGKSSVTIFGDNKRQSGMFNWKHWRTVESIFYHHPTSEIRVYSNTLPNGTFSVLTEAGYSISVFRYNLEDLLRGSPAEAFIRRLGSARRGSSWYAHEADTLRALLLYLYGGIYMDTDFIVVRPLQTLRNNSAGKENEHAVNNAFLKFDKGNLFLEAVLRRLPTVYDGGWSTIGPGLLSHVYFSSKWDKNVVNLYNVNAFYMIHYSQMKKQCFSDTQGVIFEKNMKVVHTEAYAVHLNAKISGNYGIAGDKLKDGTICKHLFNAYCILCDQIH